MRVIIIKTGKTFIKVKNFTEFVITLYSVSTNVKNEANRGIMEA